MKYPRIAEIIHRSDHSLKVRFTNDIVKTVDLTDLMNEKPFDRLRDPVLFRQARIDRAGCGIIWDESLDLSEAYLWDKGKEDKNVFSKSL